MTWRVGKKVSINVYEGNRPVCQCHNPEDARGIVAAMNRTEWGITIADFSKKNRHAQAMVKARNGKLTAERRSEIASNAARVRWANRKKAGK